jgi:hypothetical protein
MKKNVDSTVSFEGSVTSALMFFKVGSQDVALMMKWCDEQGWHSPKPIDHDEMVAIANSTSKNTEFLPDRMLTYNSEINFSWWVPAKRRKINVKKSTRKVFYYPAMVFHVLCGMLYVGCLKNNRRPTPETETYSIFGKMDVHQTRAAFCQTRKPEGVGVSTIPQWEDAFYKSTYNKLPNLKRWEPNGTVGSICTK